MKFIVAVDCEGVAATVGSPGASLNESRNLKFAQLQATREADACAKGFFDAEADQVIVWDNHGGSLNLHYDLLDERCDIALGVGFTHRFPGLDSSFAGVAFIGYHAMDNTEDAVMCHTFSSATYQSMKINETQVGELAIDGAVAGSHDVPVVFVASDDKGTAEAQSFFENVATVTTKEALGWNAAISKHPQRAIAEIRAGAKAAAERLDVFAPFRFIEPVSLEIRYKRIEAAQSASRGLKAGERTDPYTVRWLLDSLADYF
jgi:D-amino peptidase